MTGEAWVGLELAQWDPRWVLSASEWDRGSSSKAALDCWGRALGPAAVHPPLCSPAASPPGSRPQLSSWGGHQTAASLPSMR